MTIDRRSILAGMAGLMTGLPSASFAQAAYPNGPIRLIVPFPPGGGTDILSRLTMAKISQNAGWNFVVDNRPGAGGNIGLDVLAKSKPDGYTIGMGQTSNLAVNPTLYASIPYDSLKDFVPVALIAAQPVILCVRPDAPYKNLKDFLAAAGKGDGLSMGTSGSGTITHLTGELLAARAKVRFVHVPYKGASPSITDLMGGQLDFSFVAAPGALPMIRDGKIRPLAVSSAKRLQVLPEVPTIAESGFPGFESTDWKAVVAPAGTPAPIVGRINAEVVKVLSDPEFVKRLSDEGSEARPGTPQAFATFLKAEFDSWSKIIRDAGLKVK